MNRMFWLNLLHLLTNGRPMRYLGFAFTDVVSGKAVNYYESANGHFYLATSRWGFDRMTLKKAVPMKTLTRDEAKARFGKLTEGSGATFHFLEFEDKEGRWIPVYDERFNMIRYELKEDKQ